MKNFVIMLAFFTRIPVRTQNGAELFGRGIKYLPIIGLLLGILPGAVMLLTPFLGRYLCAFLALAAYLWLGGALHVDGLSDTADAIGSGRDRQTMLRILKDSHTGAFGVLAVCMYTLGMLLCIAQADTAAAWLFPLAGRAAVLLCARVFPAARAEGLGAQFMAGVGSAHVIFGCALFFAAALAASVAGAWQLNTLRFVGISASFVFALALTTLSVSRLSCKLGGITGDVIGFSAEFCQLVFLLLSCASVALLQAPA